MFYIIRRKNHYWSNIFGWTVKKEATVFYEIEKEAYTPPAGSEWIQLKDRKTDKSLIRKTI